MAAKNLETVSGTVEATNEKGVKVAGEWHNFSRYADVPRPTKGQRVQLQVERTDRGTWVNSVEFSEDASTNGQDPAPSTSHETVITRLAVLRSAAQFLSTRPDAKSADVLRVAESWENWVNRQD